MENRNLSSKLINANNKPTCEVFFAWDACMYFNSFCVIQGSSFGSSFTTVSHKMHHIIATTPVHFSIKIMSRCGVKMKLLTLPRISYFTCNIKYRRPTEMLGEKSAKWKGDQGTNVTSRK